MKNNITKIILGLFLLMGSMVVTSFAEPLTDEQIEKAAKDSYVYRKYLKDNDVSVTSKEGIVTLKGTVDNDNQKKLAEETMQGMPDVKSVDNQLEVKNASEDKTSDQWIETKVKAALLFHRSVSALDTEVEVKDGVVTLKGEAESLAQKDLTTQYANDVDGVKSVDNQITISSAPKEEEKETMTEKVDDASITAQIKTMLFAHRSTSALRTKVETKDGKVTLTGKAKNQAEKDLVTKLVSDMDGVKDVNNEMTVEEK